MNKECYGDMKKNEFEKLPVVDEKCEMFSEKTYTDGIRLDTKSFEKNKFEFELI